MTEEEFVSERLSSKIKTRSKKTRKSLNKKREKKALQSKVPIGPDGKPIFNYYDDSDDDDYFDPYGPLPESKNWLNEGMVTMPHD